jgi:hypothetical protein
VSRFEVGWIGGGELMLLVSERAGMKIEYVGLAVGLKFG